MRCLLCTLSKLQREAKNFMQIAMRSLTREAISSTEELKTRLVRAEDQGGLHRADKESGPGQSREDSLDARERPGEPPTARSLAGHVYACWRIMPESTVMRVCVTFIAWSPGSSRKAPQGNLKLT